MQNTSWVNSREAAEHTVRTTSYLVRFVRGGRLAAHLLIGVLTVLLLFPLLAGTRRRWLKQVWSRRLLRILNVQLDGVLPEAGSGCLFVANHISWLDIYALNAFRPMAFVGKSEVRRWPVIGWLAAHNDTVFLHRNSGRHAHAVNREIATRLMAGQDVALFPEGTTSDGYHLLGFHGALFQSAIEADCAVVPVALSYLDASGEHSGAPAYAGETTLLQSLARVLACSSLTVRVRCAAPITPSAICRRELVRSARGAIAFNLGLSLNDE